MAIMLQGVLRMPLPDNPADLGPMMWAQIKGRMREAADEIDRLEREVSAWRERFPVAGYDGNSIVLSG